MRAFVVVLVLVCVAFHAVAGGPWGGDCPPGYHPVYHDDQNDPDYGGVTCEPDAESSSSFAIWWPVDPASVVAEVAKLAGGLLLVFIGLAAGFLLIRHLLERVERAVSADDGSSMLRGMLLCTSADGFKGFTHVDDLRSCDAELLPRHVSLKAGSGDTDAHADMLAGRGYLHVDHVEDWEEQNGRPYTGNTYDDYA